MDTLDYLQEDVLITRFITILTYVSENTGETSHVGSQDVRASGRNVFPALLNNIYCCVLYR